MQPVPSAPGEFPYPFAVDGRRYTARRGRETPRAQVGCTLKIDEVSAGGAMPLYRAAISQNAVLNATGNAQGDSSELPISLGTIPVKAEVIVSYSLK